ncbi:Amidohydrolase family protein [Flavobacterium sp. CF108]|uniref:amidohydrolase family protein n=1 Tax=unclassified Flavobacterium TaxID=196869 RepID=UPI0008C22D3B|nr:MULTISPECIES: amidohydrolase family protein [unclassified Flavobacterium]SEO94487.1 Amidohydrolase family protein [Flavobacterium sp. fv08]SHH82692.1 Amidohydrolase family protein [Flavobacterium sp. CF108]
MKKLWFRRFIYAIMILLVIIICVFIWSDNELNKVLGKSTKVIPISSFVKPSKTIQIKNVNILSEDCTSFIKNQTIVIENGKIVSLGKNQPLDSTAIIIDGTNKFLIPGLIDSHVHLKESQNDLFLYLANGITYIREMAGRPVTLKWRKAIKKNGIGPRMFIASPPIYSESGLSGYYFSWTRQAINYSTKEDAQKEIKKIKEQGYDAVKMYGFVNPEIYKTTIEISKENNLPVIGHIPLVNLDTLYHSGQKEVAHIEELTIKNMDDFGKSISKNPKEYINFLKIHSKLIAKKLKENNICVTSTISLVESFPQQRFDLKSRLREIELKYANPKIIEGSPIYKLGWLPGKNGYEYDGEDNPEALKSSLTFWNTYVEAIHIMTKALIDNNVTIMAGTDANVATIVPGFSLHNELQSLAKAGMTNSQVLYSATVEPSNWLKSKTGKIKTGYNSDLILLSKNPLEDIKNTKTIESVFFGKYMMNKNQITSILKAIENANNENRSIKIDEFLN